MGLNELRKKRKKLENEAEQRLMEMNKIILESERVIDITHHSKQILDNIDIQFENNIGLNKTDVTFLFFATMLQTLRWVLLPELKIPKIDELNPMVDKSERLKSNEKNHIGGIYDGKKSGIEYELNALNEYKNRQLDKVKESQKEFYSKKNEYRSWIEILTQPVPYDAMNALDRNFIPGIAGLNKQNPNGTFKNICGKNHHVATLGHDPVLGWIFGTANIMTNTISFADLQSYDVVQGHRIKSLGTFAPNKELQFSDQAIDYLSPRTLASILSECVMSTEEDYKRIVAAVVREAIHLESDKYCKEGLPMPILSMIDTKKAQALIEQGWNSIEFRELFKNDLKQIGLGAGLAILINIIIETIYMFCLKADEDVDIRKIKIKKIQSVSEVMATSSNVLYVALSKNVSKLDIGGIGITMFTLLNSQKFIQEMKEEYIKKCFNEVVMRDRIKEDK